MLTELLFPLQDGDVPASEDHTACVECLLPTQGFEVNTGDKIF